jgi:D-alanyl-D-alanine carboxypeptidase
MRRFVSNLERMKLGACALFAWLAGAILLPAQAAPPSRPAHAVTFESRITTAAQGAVADGRAPGLAIGVVRDGTLVYARGFGYANIARHEAVTPDTEFFAAGITRQFTAAAVLLLVQDGKLRLDDRVTRFYPDLQVASGVTVAQLLTQTSGLPSPSALSAPLNDFTKSIRATDLMAAIANLKPAAPAGSVYADNPLNYLLAGAIVESVSGEPLSDFLQQRIFVPLVMEHTFLAGDTGIASSVATGYTRTARSGPFVMAKTWDSAWLAGDRGLVTTVSDLAKWDTEMPILLRDDAVRTIFTAAATSQATQYGMGWVIDRRGGERYVWYADQIPGYATFNALLPDKHDAVIVLTNADSLESGHVPTSIEVSASVLDALDPAQTDNLDNAVIMRARDWLARLADKRIDRTQLTPAFSRYLSDQVVSRANVAAYGKLVSIVPLSSSPQPNGDTLYVFLVRFAKGQYHYRFTLTDDGKIDGLYLVS